MASPVSFVASAPLRETLRTIDGAALVVATALLTMKYQRLGNDCVAAGFLSFLAGETLLLAGNAAGLEASVPSYFGGISLWAAALLMIGGAQHVCALDAAHRAWGPLQFQASAPPLIWLPPSSPRKRGEGRCRHRFRESRTLQKKRQRCGQLSFSPCGRRWIGAQRRDGRGVFQRSEAVVNLL
ncbi:hypothetical protein [Mesorhizobium sp. B2-1-3]|uniref:hypothetical protein n=1 Tax=Mesorhizobium sp. B2-1-3 TaxID=2589972 RepID=UPI001FEE67A8|nr:hypothetical protein [Mesorhizobium sp. B2-1-3]